MQTTQTPKAGERTQGRTDAFGFLQDMSGCTFHFSEHGRDLTIRANDGGKIGLTFTDKIAALRIDREQSPEVIAAAPELLETLRTLYKLIDDNSGRPSVVALFAGMEKAKAAIAAAEGREL